MANLFISFLGANRYSPCKYYFNESKNDLSPNEVVYVQEDLMRIFCKDWKKDDRFIVFTTDLAIENNWDNLNTGYNPELKNVILEEGKGLSFRGKAMNSAIDFRNQWIPDGANETQMWEIFSAIVNEIKPNDNIYLDITYSFRFIPTLSAVLLNYAKAVKKATVKGIFYGNYEVGRHQNNECPIVELSSFDTLQKWTNAANIFNKYGVSDELVNLLDDYSELKMLSGQLSDFTTAIHTCRGHELNTQININQLKQNIHQQKNSNSFVAQFNPLIQLIEDKIKPFQHQTVLNGLSATQWCINHNLIQQGYTFLQETLKSYIVDKVFGKDFLDEYSYRNLAHIGLWSANIRKIERQLNNYNRGDKPYTRIYRTQPIPNKANEIVNLSHSIKPIYIRFTGSEGSRNDISHCGYNPTPRTGEELKQELKELMAAVKALHLI